MKTAEAEREASPDHQSHREALNADHGRRKREQGIASTQPRDGKNHQRKGGKRNRFQHDYPIRSKALAALSLADGKMVHGIY